MNVAGAVRRAESRRFLIFSVLSLESSFPGEHGVYIHIGWIKRIARYAAIAPEGASLLGLGGVCSVISGLAMRDASPATLKIVYDLSGYIARRLAQLPNASLHDFRAANEVTHDLNNYSDVIHHSPAVDLKVLSWLAAGNYVVDRAAPEASLQRLKAQVTIYSVGEF